MSKHCIWLDNNSLNVNGRIDGKTFLITPCCESLPNIPHVLSSDRASDTLENMMAAYLAAKDAFKAEKCIYDCGKCSCFCDGEPFDNNLIRYINFSVYPSPCQCRCIYCSVYKENQNVFTEAARAGYDKLFETISLAESRGLIAKDSMYQVACGEFALHPYHNRIMDFVTGKRVCFYTNCIKFDASIAAELHSNIFSSINFSVDSGTSETWHEVKGLNNFDIVIANLIQYINSAKSSEQIKLKYIVLPGINDGNADYEALADFMVRFNLKKLEISHDVNMRYKNDSDYDRQIADSVGRLVKIFSKAHIACNTSTLPIKIKRSASQSLIRPLRSGSFVSDTAKKVSR